MRRVNYTFLGLKMRQL